MTVSNKTEIVRNLEEKSLLVSRAFNAPLANVWRAFTESELLDQWWAPAPWCAETKSMDFSVGGYWHYAMISPENQQHWGRMDYLAIDHHKSFRLEDGFCDEEGNINPALPVSKGQITFTETAGGTRVEFRMVYPTEADLQKIIEMGVEQGIAACFDQLGILLSEAKF